MASPLQNQFEQVLNTPGVAPNPFERVLAHWGIVKQDVRRSAMRMQELDVRHGHRMDEIDHNVNARQTAFEKRLDRSHGILKPYLEDPNTSAEVTPEGGLRVTRKDTRERKVGQASQPRPRGNQERPNPAPAPVTPVTVEDVVKAGNAKPSSPATVNEALGNEGPTVEDVATAGKAGKSRKASNPKPGSTSK